MTAPDRPRPVAEGERPVRDEGTARANLAARDAMPPPIAQHSAAVDRAGEQTPRANGTPPQGGRQQGWRQRQQAWQQRYQAWQQRQQGGQQAQGAQEAGQRGDRIGNQHPNNPRPGGWKKTKSAGGKGLRRGSGRRRL